MTLIATTVLALCTVIAVPKHDPVRHMTIVERAFGPCEVQPREKKRQSYITQWGNYFRESKLARIPTATAAIEPVKAAPVKKVKKPTRAKKRASKVKGCKKGRTRNKRGVCGKWTKP
jgi:hypothetical protein